MAFLFKPNELLVNFKLVASLKINFQLMAAVYNAQALLH